MKDSYDYLQSDETLKNMPSKGTIKFIQRSTYFSFEIRKRSESFTMTVFSTNMNNKKSTYSSSTH